MTSSIITSRCIHLRARWTKILNLLFIFSLTFFVSVPSSAHIPGMNQKGKGKFVLQFEVPRDPQQKEIMNNLKHDLSFHQIVAKLNSSLELPKDITVLFREDHEGPYFDNEINAVVMTYGFILETEEAFNSIQYAQTPHELHDAIMGATEFAFYHELGHALIQVLHIPILGKEEDAVDNLATIMLNEFTENGSSAVIYAADLFDIEDMARSKIGEEDYWDEHSMDAQRFYSVICMLYGSDTKEFSFLIEDLEIPKDRADLCEIDYQRIMESWLMVLGPYIKQPVLPAVDKIGGNKK